MTININHDLRVVNGGTIYMPPWEGGNDKWGNLAIPDVNAIGTDQNYPTGTIYRIGIRTFVHSLTDATYYGEGGTQAIGAGYGMESASTFNDISAGVSSGTSGESTIIVDLGTSGLVNSYAGGFIGIKKSTGNRQTVGRYSSFQIISNTVTSSNLTTMTLDGTLPVDMATSDHVVLTEHPYSVCRHPTNGPYGMTIGYLVCTTVASSYLWLQTGGPHNMIAANGPFEGDSTYSIPVFSTAGTTNQPADGVTAQIGSNYTGNYQIVGHTYSSTKSSGASGAGTVAGIGVAVWLTILQ